MREPLRIGAGAGFSGDRLEPAAVLAERGGIRLSRARMPRRAHGRARAAAQAQGSGARLRPVARAAHRAAAAAAASGTACASSPTWARPIRSPRPTRSSPSRERKRLPIRVAVVTGDDVLAKIEPGELTLETRHADRELRRARFGQRLSRRRGAAARAANRAPTSSSRDASPIRRCSSRRWRTSTAGSSTTSIGSRAARRSGICSNARAALRRLLRRARDARTCPTWRIWAFPTPTSTPTATRRWARSTAPAAASRSPPRRSSCSTRSPIRSAT